MWDSRKRSFPGSVVYIHLFLVLSTKINSRNIAIEFGSILYMIFRLFKLCFLEMIVWRTNFRPLQLLLLTGDQHQRQRQPGGHVGCRSPSWPLDPHVGRWRHLHSAAVAGRSSSHTHLHFGYARYRPVRQEVERGHWRDGFQGECTTMYPVFHLFTVINLGQI